ncbi:MAG: hypothetical protein OEV22_15995 [Deltaproteobacteria bacterium]|nr:hypothetical protein [Deltaproteobacteria bacterium]
MGKKDSTKRWRGHRRPSRLTNRVVTGVAYFYETRQIGGQDFLVLRYYKHFCPSCHQKRLVEFGEWLCKEVTKAVPHRHFVFTITKILRRYFIYDRKLLSDLSRCAWETLKVYLKTCVPVRDGVPGGDTL